MFKKYSILIAIVLLAVFLRFWQLGDIPPGVHADEADTGYSAYSILKTGLDPHGEFNILALSDSNTGGTHPPVYTYLLIPLVKFFGLNIFVERLPSAILGSLTILLAFLLANKLFKSNAVSNIVALLLALNPWAIHISRQGLLEAESLFFVLLGVVLFLYSDKKKYFLILSAFSFGLSLYAYDAPKIFLPPFLLLLLYFYRAIVFKAKAFFITFILIFSIFYISMLQLTFLKGDIKDYSRSSIFSNIAQGVDSERFLTNAPLWLSSIFHNKLSVSLKKFETSYASVFSTNWFFVNGSRNLQHAVGNHGQFFLFELPFFFIGIYLVFRKNFKLGIFLLGWILIGALPGGLTNGNYAYRSVHILPIPIVFSSISIVWFWELLSKKRSLKNLAIKLVILTIMTTYVSSYLVTYFFDYPVYASEYWNKEQNDAIKFVSEKKNDYKTIFVDGGEPWVIEYAFFNKIDPRFYQSAYKNIKTFNGKKVMQISNIYFGIFQLEYANSLSEFFPKDSMIVTNAINFPKNPYSKSFKDPGKVRDIFKIFEVK